MQFIVYDPANPYVVHVASQAELRTSAVRYSRPSCAKVVGRGRGRPPNSSYSAEELTLKKDRRAQKERAAHGRRKPHASPLPPSPAPRPSGSGVGRGTRMPAARQVCCVRLAFPRAIVHAMLFRLSGGGRTWRVYAETLGVEQCGQARQTAKECHTAVAAKENRTCVPVRLSVKCTCSFQHVRLLPPRPNLSTPAVPGRDAGRCAVHDHGPAAARPRHVAPIGQLVLSASPARQIHGRPVRGLHEARSSLSRV